MLKRTLLQATAIGFLLAPAALAEPPKAGAADGGPPGVVIDTSPDFQRVYIGCPSIAMLPGGDYAASHSFFGPGTKMNRTRVFRSADRGKTWQRVADVHGQWWSTLFVHRGALYIMGTSRRYGDVVIRRSADGGRTWTEPEDRKSGLLCTGGHYHTAPVPVVVHGGRIWRAMEDQHPTISWPQHFRAFVLSAPVEADLLDADAWLQSNRLAFDPAWLKASRPGWLEGNIVVTPEGKPVNILRVNDERGDRAAIARISDDGRRIGFDPERDFIDLPGGRTKFTIRFDPQTKRYWSLVNKQRDPPAERNVLALASSADLRQWRVERIALKHPDRRHHALQYVDWLFEGPDLVAVSRTAWDGSHNFHDANYFTFHRVRDFRARSPR